MSEWISVNDRLPERYKEVLCFPSCGTDSLIISYISCMYGDEPIWCDEVTNFTHWMPLPKPPGDL